MFKKLWASNSSKAFIRSFWKQSESVLLSLKVALLLKLLSRTEINKNPRYGMDPHMNSITFRPIMPVVSINQSWQDRQKFEQEFVVVFHTHRLSRLSNRFKQLSIKSAGTFKNIWYKILQKPRYNQIVSTILCYIVSFSDFNNEVETNCGIPDILCILRRRISNYVRYLQKWQ